jgi:hypothetical protein
LKVFIAEAEGLVSESNLEIYPIAQEWKMGTGTYLDVPITTNGACWVSPTFNGSVAWSSSGTDSNGNLITSSYNSSYTSQGGGSWFYEDNSSNSYKLTQSFDIKTYKDIKIDVKNIVENWYSGSLENNGFIVKWEDTIEFNSSSAIQPILQFFSSDTNTIYPPQLEIKWDDYSSVLNLIPTSSILTDPTNILISVTNNIGTFKLDSVNKFRLNIAPKYPIKTWSTESIFVSTNYLPSSSFYAVKDLDTNEMIIDFDDIYTKISSDSNGNFFTLYMNGLQPERYYKILIKTIMDGTTLIIDDNYYFKIING